jgi:glycosyl transferase family 87
MPFTKLLFSRRSQDREDAAMAAPPIEHPLLVVWPPILGLVTAALEHCRFSKRDAARSLVFVLFLGSVVAVLFELDYPRAFAPSRGGDAQIYCAAREAYDAGLSPYLVSNLQRFHAVHFSFVYPLHALLLLRLFCFGDATFRFTVLYWACLVLAFLLSASRLRAWPDRGLLAVLLLGGFSGTAYNFATGNIGLVELLGFSVCYYFLIRNRPAKAALALGATASFKLVPILFALPFLFLPRTQTRGRLVVYSCLALAASLAVSYAMSPSFFRDFVLQLFGLHPNQHAPINEVWPESNPVFLLALRVFLSDLRIDSPVPISLVAAVMIFAMISFLVTLRRGGLDDVRLFCMGTLFVILLMPRMKPYSFTYAVLPVFSLIRGGPRSLQVGILLLSVWVPALLFNQHIMAVAEYLARGPMQVWALTYQMGCLFLCASLFAVTYLRRMPGGNSS